MLGVPPISRGRLLWLLGAALALIAAFAAWRAVRPVPADSLVEVVDPGVELTGSVPGGQVEEPAPPATVTVHVTGPVAHPGIVTLPAGARVGDAVQAAGGFASGAAPGAVNLARPLTDGERLDLAAPAVPGAPDEAPGAAPAAGGKVDLNRASAQELDELPGVGPVLAERIIAYRTENGPFASVEQLQEVPGIGESRLADLSPRVTVGRG